MKRILIKDWFCEKRWIEMMVNKAKEFSCLSFVWKTIKEQNVLTWCHFRNHYKRNVKEKHKYEQERMPGE